MKLEDSVFTTGILQDEQAPRGAKINFDVTGARVRVFSRIGVPVTRHRVAVRVQLGLNVAKAVEGLAGRPLHFKLEQPVKRQENRDWGDDERYDQRNGNGKITSLALGGGDVKRCRQRRAESEAEKESSADANNSADNSEKNCANGEFILSRPSQECLRRSQCRGPLEQVDPLMCSCDFHNESRVIPPAQRLRCRYINCSFALRTGDGN